MISFSEMTILITDDMEPMCKSIRGMLRVLNYGKTFIYAHNGRDAWKILNEKQIDLAILDWNMPIMTGIELVGLIREDRKLRDMPVIIITAESNRDIVAEAAESDIDAYILKPLTIKSLGSRIETAINKANNPSPMIAHLKKSREFEEKNDIDSAIVEAKLAKNADSSSSRPLRELGSLYLKMDDVVNAEKYLMKAAKMNRLDAIAFHHLGTLYVKLDDIDNAEKFFDKAMRISPRHLSRGIKFGKVLLEKKKFKKAIRVFDNMIKLSNEPIVVSEKIADYCMAKDAFSYAADLYNFILRKVPDRYDLLPKLGVATQKAGDYRNAIEFLNKAEHNFKEDIEIKFHLAECYIAIDQVLRADKKISEILQIDPDNEEAISLKQRI
jgi:DNA-binding response OmpR family regulator